MMFLFPIESGGALCTLCEMDANSSKLYSTVGVALRVDGEIQDGCSRREIESWYLEEGAARVLSPALVFCSMKMDHARWGRHFA